MVTFTVRSYVGKDGMLKLQVPTGMADTDVEAVVVMLPQSVEQKNLDTLGYPRFFFEETFGSVPELEDWESPE